MRDELVEEDPEIEKREMKLHKMIVGADSPLIGKTMRESGLRDQYGCMVVGVEEGQRNLTLVNPHRRFERGDVVWVVGEQADIEKLKS